MPKVSIILPTYNGDRFIGESIRSCLIQTFFDFELIIVIDGSTDATISIINSYRDERVKTVIHQENKKLPTALNTGFRQASGEYFIWIADDDYFAKDAVESLTNFLDKNPNADAVYGDYCRVDEFGNSPHLAHLAEQDSKAPLNTPAFLYRRNLFFEIGGYKPDCFRYEDYEFWLQVWCRYRMEYIPTVEPLYYLRERPGSLTDKHKWWVHEQSAKLRHKLLGLSFTEYLNQLSIIHIHVANEAFRNQRWAKTIRHLVRAIVQKPKWIFDRGVISIFISSVTALIGNRMKPFTSETTKEIDNSQK